MTQLTQSYYCGASQSQIIYETIGNYFDRTCESNPEVDALVVQQLQEQVNSLAAGLLALGIQAGDRVGIWGPNSAEWVMVQLATAKIGAIMVCINPAYRTYELEYALNKVECDTIITAEQFKSSDYLGILQTLAPELADCEPCALQSKTLPHLKRVIRMGKGKSPGRLNFDDVCAMGSPRITRVLRS
jgi:fatty-acyl-CoA synthase